MPPVPHGASGRQDVARTSVSGPLADPRRGRSAYAGSCRPCGSRLRGVVCFRLFIRLLKHHRQPRGEC